MMYPWLASAWQRMLALGERLPHALLLVGPAGLGKRELAEALAARLLCDAPKITGEACGQCQACLWRISGNHPDLFYLVPEAEAAQMGNQDVDVGESGEGRTKSSQIVIEQVRQLQTALSVTGHHSARRVVIVDPAEGMNVFTANALLKLLEEPPVGCVLILISSVPRRLLATIRSRCQQWTFACPDPETFSDVLLKMELDPTLLALCGGAPLAASRLAQKGGAEFLQRFILDLQSIDPLHLAGQWESWLRSKEAQAAGFDLMQLATWMQCWVADLTMLVLGGRVRFFPAYEKKLAALASPVSVAAAMGCYNEIGQIRRAAQHPLNLRLVLDDMLLRYSRVFDGTRKGL